MKKRVLLMIVLASTSLFALAQSNVGDWSLMPKLGLNLATMTNDDDTKFRPAFVAGAEVEYVATSQFLVSFGALYSQQGCEGKADGYDATIKLDYINVPFLAHYRVIDKFAIKAGLQLGFLINDKIKASGNGVSAEVGLEDTFKAAGIDVNLTTIDIADSVDICGMWNVECGRIDRDGAVGGEGDTEGFEVQAFCSRLAACSHQDDIGLNALCIPFLILEEHFTISNLLDATLHVERNAILFHLLAQAFGDITIKGWETLLQIFNHRHL